MKSIPRASLLFFLSLFFAAGLSEGFLRLSRHAFLPRPQSETELFLQTLNERMMSLWTDDASSTDPFLPPLSVYADTEIHDEARLLKIYEATKLPPNQSWQSYDFLRPYEMKDKTAYQITSNAVGFRGRAAKREKPKNVFRIIALGDYHPFGHGVGDDESYVPQLEHLLNKNPKRKFRFEVWNGGRHAGTAIIALARMKYEVLEYAPDMLILDYGFVDPLVWGDDLMLSTLRIPQRARGIVTKAMQKVAVQAMKHSILLQKLRTRSFQRPGSFHGYIETMKEILRIAGEKKIPVILVKEMANRMPKEEFLPLLTKNVALVDVREAFSRNAPSPEMYSRASDSWIAEVPRAARQFPHFQFYPYRLDFFQLNRLGHSIVARALYDKVQNILGAP